MQKTTQEIFRIEKDNSGKSVSQAFEKIFTGSERKPRKLWVDKGKEFYNKDVQKLVELYSTENEENLALSDALLHY